MACKEEQWSFETIEGDTVDNGKLVFNTAFEDTQYKKTIWERKLKQRFLKDIFFDDDIFLRSGVQWVNVQWRNKWLQRCDYKNWEAKKCVEEYLQRVTAQDVLNNRRDLRSKLRAKELENVQTELTDLKRKGFASCEDSDEDDKFSCKQENEERDSDLEILNDTKDHSKSADDSDIEILAN